MTIEALEAYVGSGIDDTDYVTSCFTTASAMVANYIGSASTIPTVIIDRAVLEVGSELFHRRNAPSGISQFAGFDGTPLRVARDPMVSAIPLLRDWMIPF